MALKLRVPTLHRQRPEPVPETKLDAQLLSLRRRARLWTAACVLSGAVAFTGNVLPQEWLGVPGTALVVFLGTMWPAFRARERYGHEVRRREAQPISVDQINAFESPPVLYLRSFDDDRRAARIKGALTEEEHLRSVVSQIGPFVAIGRPGESLPSVGAMRVYVGDERWQATVEDLLRTAKLVIIRTGGTHGLGWEIERAVRVLPPERLVVLVDSTRELRNLLAVVGSEHPHVRRRLWMGWRSIGSIRGFVVFDAAWQATPLPARGPGFYFFCNNADGVGYATKRLARTLRPVFHRAGMTWRRPPLNWGLILTSGLAAALFVAAVVASLLGY